MEDNTVKIPKNANRRLSCDRLRNSRAFNILYDKGVLYFILAFCIPFFFMLHAFKTEGIHSFFFVTDKATNETSFGLNGDRQMLVVDLWHQYFPFFRVVREKLLTGGSFLYSWQNGMGTNFLSLISYYAASPLNWISALFSEEHSREVMTYILAAKIGFAGAFFSCFLRYVFKRKDFSIVVFSSMFALCSYMLGYYWNVMWFDTVALFPLVMLGITAMCREKKWLCYTISLALSLISNYYIGFFTCIFSVFMFAAAAVINWDGVKNFFIKLWLIVRSSVIGIGLGAFMLLPSYFALKLTHSANNVFPQTTEWYHKWQEIFGNLLSYSPPTAKDGLPNLACGMLAVVLIGVFVFSAGIKIREKISAVLMLAIIAVSCNMNKLNYIWHGFHITNQLPYRYSFIFSFVLTAAAFRAYDIMTRRGIKIYQLFLLILGPGAVFWCSYSSVKASEESLVMDAAFKSSLIITGAYILIFVACRLLPLKNTVLRRSVLNLGLAAAVFTELSANAVLGVKTVGSSDYASYPTQLEGVQDVLAQMNADEAESLFSRAEMTGTYTLNDSALYGYKGVSQFSSSANVSVTKLFKRLGLYASEAGNRFYYRTSTPVVNGILGIDYIISRNGPIPEPNPYLEEYAVSGSVNMYRNTHPLSLGFMMNSDIKYLQEVPGENPFEYQNRLMRLASGIDRELFTPQPVVLAHYNNMEPLKKSYGHYSFSALGVGGVDADYDFVGVENGCLFGYGKNGCYDSINVTKNGSSVESNVSFSDYPVVFPMGDVQPGETVTLELNFPAEKIAGVYEFVVYSLDKVKYDEMYNSLADEQLKLTEFDDTRIEGSISAAADGVLYLSIPYEKGWSLYVDGKKTETFPVLDAMTGADITAGEHEILLKYSPEGFKTGLVVSFSAFGLLILFVWLDSRRRKNAPQAEIAETDEYGEIIEIIEEPVEAAVSGEAQETASEERTDEQEIPEEENEKSESDDGVPGD
ncbi:MAG: YfhO family protein [Ruminococcus sp.]|nr:YfhO family protein [Ruminococcus sp.]